MLSSCHSNPHLSVPSSIDGIAPLRFELQPIMDIGTGIVFGCELLFRGRRSHEWCTIDSDLVTYLGKRKMFNGTLFVNVSNESILGIGHDVFVGAAMNNDIVFEITESAADSAVFDRVVDKINLLSADGLRFAIDDFGSGQDGMKRLYAVDTIAVVKIDGAFVRTSMRRSDAARALKTLVALWRASEMLVIAEGIEDDDMLAFARNIGADLIQGWHADAMQGVPLLSA